MIKWDKVFLIITFLFVGHSSLLAQIGIGQWRDHLPYSEYIAVDQSSNFIYAATPYGLVTINKNDQSIQRLNKINGLSDNRIQDIAVSESNTLLIAYQNTNIDLIKNEQIINIPDIKRKSIIGNKSINKIHLHHNLAYLACGFGIVVIDIAKEEVMDTYYIGPNGTQLNVQDIVINDTAIYAASDEGLFYASLTSANLADFSNWNLIQDIPSPSSNYNLIEYFQDHLILNNKLPGYNTDSLYIFDGLEWSSLNFEQNSDQLSVKKQNGNLLICRNMDVIILDENLQTDFKIWSLSQAQIFPNDAMINSNSEVWIADKYSGLIRTWNEGNDDEFIQLSGPFSSNVYAMDAFRSQLWVTTGARTNSWAPQYNREGFFHFTDEAWTNYHCLNEECDFPALDSIRDMISVKINPNDQQQVFIGTWERGLIELNNGDISQVYTDINSSLGAWTVNPDRILVSGLDFDSDGNLWIANSGAEDILSVKTFDNQWQSFNLGNQNSGIDISTLLIDDYNQQWIIPRRSHSLIVYTGRNTPTDLGDDEWLNLSSSQGNGGLFASNTYCMAKDLDGELWLGTNEGIGVIYNPENVFSGGNFDVQRVLVEFDGYTQYLLETEVITSIAIDGANQKWIGTQNSGIYLLSDDGREQIHHFTEENSPLFSNTITSLAILKNGEVFIGTALGLQSYRGEASQAAEEEDEVYAFPNPVPESYSGTIAIKNLMQDANVKITDISGNVVFETYALGGQAVWDGRNFDGEKAHSGVYLVFASNIDGSTTLVTKILIIN